MEMIRTASPAAVRGGRRQIEATPGSRRRLPVFTAGMSGHVRARAEAETKAEADTKPMPKAEADTKADAETDPRQKPKPISKRARSIIGPAWCLDR